MTGFSGESELNGRSSGIGPAARTERGNGELKWFPKLSTNFCQ